MDKPHITEISKADDETPQSTRSSAAAWTHDVANIDVARDLLTRHRPRSALKVLDSLRSQQHSGAGLYAPILESGALLELGHPNEALLALERAQYDADSTEADNLSTSQWSRNKALAKLRIGRLLSAREDFNRAATLEAAIRRSMLKEVKSENNKGAPGLMLEACRLDLQKLQMKDSESSDKPSQDQTTSTSKASSSWGLLSRTDLQELRSLMAVSAEERNAERCADIVEPLRFFRRFSMQQCADFLREGDLVEVPAAAYIVRQGDPAGPMYVLLSGVVCIEMIQNSTGAEKVIMNTLYDGQVFGELASMTGFEAKRTASVLAQEDTVLLMIDPAFYFRVISEDTAGAEQGERQDLLLKLPMFEGCKRLQLMSLAANLELLPFRYDEAVLVAGQRPPRFLILVGGTCDLVVDKGGAKGGSLLFESLRPGGTLGHGILMEADGECRYTSNVAVVVTSAHATFFAMTRRSIFYLPDAVQNMILTKLPTLPDPICGDVKGLISHDKLWQRRKKSLFREMVRVGDAPPVLTRERSASSSELFFRPMSAGHRKVAPNDSHVDMERIMRRFDKGKTVQQKHDTLGLLLPRFPMRPRACGTQSQPILGAEKAGVI